jgi:hypothetical protein
LYHTQVHKAFIVYIASKSKSISVKFKCQELILLQSPTRKKPKTLLVTSPL